MIKFLQVLVLVVAVLHCCPEASGFPSFSTLWSNYPSYSSYSTDAMIDLAKLRIWLYGSNTCAIRVSYALIESGHDIDIKCSDNCNWSRVKQKSSPRKKYIIRQKTMKCYLEGKLGSPVSVSSESDASGKKGIISFQDCPNFQTATGHVDLFDGSNCAGTCYFNDCNNIAIFTIN